MLLVLAAIAPAGSAGQPSQPAALHVAPDGSDGNDGRSRERSLRTIGAALGRAMPGTRILLHEGTYHEQVVTSRAGRKDAPITIQNAGNGRAVIDGSRLAWRPASDQNQGLVELRHPFIRLSGVAVTRSPNTGVLLGADELVVENCQVSNAGLHAISTHTDRQTRYPGRPGTMIRQIRLVGNIVEGSPANGQGQAISLIADGFQVRGNMVRNNPREGIDIWLGARDGEVVGNIVNDNGEAGIYVDGATNVRISRNRVFRNGAGIGISSEDPNYRTRDILVDTNLVTDNRTSGIFLWDESRRGYHGVQRVHVLHNSLVGNRHAFYLSGREHEARFLNNLAWSRRANVSNNAQRSVISLENNVWLSRPSGFLSARDRKLELVSGSPAIDKGQRLPTAIGERNWVVDQDFSRKPRSIGAGPDAGAFEFSGTQ